MTAIAGVWTPEGFVLGADGLTRNGYQKLVSFNTRKIRFASLPPQHVLAYAWCGQTALQIGTEWFDFVQISEQVMRGMKTYSSGEPPERFFRSFGGIVNLCLRKWLGGNLIPSAGLPIPETIACVAFVGYVSGIPAAKQICFCHSDYVLDEEPATVTHELVMGKPIMFSGVDPLFDTTPFPVVVDLESGVRVIGEFIQGCINAPGPPHTPPEYGGRIHIAHITPETATWADGFDPIGG
jgi:hypothetical protein